MTIGEYDALFRPFSVQEIKDVFDSMESLKASGPDGFQTIFFQKNWEMVSFEVAMEVISILEGKGVPKMLNKTLLVLIPKVENPD